MTLQDIQVSHCAKFELSVEIWKYQWTGLAIQFWLWFAIFLWSSRKNDKLRNAWLLSCY